MDLDQRHRAAEIAMTLVALLLAPLVTVVAVGTAPYVSFDSYLVVLRHMGLLIFPWVAVWAAFRGLYKLLAAAFLFTSLGVVPLTDGWWGVVVAGSVLVVATIGLNAKSDQ